MSKAALELLIKSHPMWHQVDPRHVPVTIRKTYTVLGRRMERCHTVLASTTDVHTARDTMDAANSSGLFDRLVIASGTSVNHAPADKWETIECAVPYSILVTGSSFASLLARVQTKTANINPPYDIDAQMTPLIGEKKAYPFLLGLACILAAFTMNPISLSIVSAIALLDVAFLLNKQPIVFERMQFINTTRHWAYALLNGALLLPLVLDWL